MHFHFFGHSRRFWILSIFMAMCSGQIFAQYQARTQIANRITYRSAQIHALVTGGLTSVQTYFDYGTDTNSLTSVVSGATINGTILKKVTINNLTPGALYYYRSRTYHTTTSYRDTGRFLMFVAKAPSESRYSNGIEVTDSGYVYTWGPNTYGQLGDSTTTARTKPVRPLKGDYPGYEYLGDDPTNPIIAVAGGADCYYALAANGMVYAWGRGSFYRLGNGSNTDKLVPTRVSKGIYSGTTYLGDNGANPIIAITAGNACAYALAADGMIYAWGANYNFALGDSTTSPSRSTPIKVRKGNYFGAGSFIGYDVAEPVFAISAGEYSCFAITYRSVYGWGWNKHGNLGINNYNNAMVPARVLKGAASSTYSISFGDNPDTPAMSVCAGKTHSLFLSSNGRVFASGNNTKGHLGNNTTTRCSTMVAIIGGSYNSQPLGSIIGRPIISIATADSNSFAIELSGKAYAWGDNTYKQTDSSNATYRARPVVVKKGQGPGVTNLGDLGTQPMRYFQPSGKYIFCVSGRGEVFGWGLNDSSGIGNGDTASILQTPRFVHSFDQNSVLNLINTRGSFRIYHPLWVTAHGALIPSLVNAWEDSTIISLEYGSTLSFGQSKVLDTLDEGEVKAFQTELSELYGSDTWYYRISAKSKDGISYSKGMKFYSVPAPAATQLASYYLMENGTVMASGSNEFRKLGDNTFTYKTRAVLVVKGAYPGVTYMGDDVNNPIIQIVSGLNYALALDKKGRVYAWGSNIRGQIGDSTANEPNEPVLVKSGNEYSGSPYLGGNPNNPVVYIATGARSAYAICKDGSVYAWGNNEFGQLATNSVSSQVAYPMKVKKGSYSSPTAYLGGNTENPIVKIDGGENNVYFLTASGLVLAAGSGTYYANGDSSTVLKRTPVYMKMGMYFGVQYFGDVPANYCEDISGGLDDMMALTSMNQVYGIGTNNGVGALATGASGGVYNRFTRTAKGETPGSFYIGDLPKYPIWKLGNNSFSDFGVVFNMGLVAVWGKNSDGQLGDSSATPKYLPVWTKKGNGSNCGNVYIGDDGNSPAWLVRGNLHSILALKDGRIFSMGRNDSGELANSTFGTDVWNPVAGRFSFGSCGSSLLDEVRKCDSSSTLPTTVGTHSSVYGILDPNGFINYCDCSNRLIMSIKNENTGLQVSQVSGVSLRKGTYKTYKTTSYGGIITNNKGYVMIDRKWEVAPAAQPSSPVTVRLYYPDNDYDSLVAELANFSYPSTMTSPTQMNLYKATSGAAYSYPHTVNGYLMEHGSGADSSTWVYADNGSGFTATFKVGSFSGGGGGGGGGGGAGPAPLPVAWLNFNAIPISQNAVKVFWSTASETDYPEYTLQRSYDGINFEDIYVTEGYGSDMMGAKYAYEDFQIIKEASVVYYRIFTQFAHENSTYSNIVIVNFDKASQTHIGYLAPNPSQDILYIQLHQLESGDLFVTDVAGKLVHQVHLPSSIQQLDLSFLPSGVYFMRINDGKSVKWLKQ